MLDWRIFVLLAAVCLYDGYSRHMADIAEKAANQKDGLALDDDGVVTDNMKANKLASPFANHPSHHMHILYCAS